MTSSDTGEPSLAEAAKMAVIPGTTSTKSVSSIVS